MQGFGVWVGVWKIRILSDGDSLPKTCDKEHNHHLSYGYLFSHCVVAAVKSSMVGTTCKESYILRCEIDRPLPWSKWQAGLAKRLDGIGRLLINQRQNPIQLRLLLKYLASSTLVSPFTTPIILPYITPFRECRLGSYRLATPRKAFTKHHHSHQPL